MSAESTGVGRLALDEGWPSLFNDLPAADRYLITQTVAAGWHEGWTPNREDVRCLVEFHRGEIDFDEYRNRVLAKH